jgi:MFS family permease
VLEWTGILTPDGVAGLGILVTLTMVFAFPMGLSYALLNAPAQTILHERAPAEMRGRIFTTQIVSANFFSLLPLLAIGAITDVVGISWVLTLIGVLVAAAGVASAVLARRAEETHLPKDGSPAGVGGRRWGRPASYRD